VRHRLTGRKLNRTSSHRSAMLSNMAISLVLNEQIKTTLQKAKELRPYVEKLITKARNTSLASRRNIIAIVKDQKVADKLISVLGPRYLKRPGGYCRIIKAGFRHGDMASVAYIELLDRNIDEKGAYTQRNERKSEDQIDQ
jgi:large subunit ribosomal protein L17